MVTNGAIEPLSEVDRWNRQLADSVSQKLSSNMRIPQERCSAFLHDPLSSRNLKFEVICHIRYWDRRQGAHGI
jgi:hypothetical protein